MSPRETALLKVLETVAAGEDFDAPLDWNQYEAEKTSHSVINHRIYNALTTHTIDTRLRAEGSRIH